MNYIYWLSQIQHSEQSLVGDKLFILSQLLQDEYSVLPGFVLGNNLFRQFLANINNDLSRNSHLFSQLDVDDYRALQLVANRSRKIIERALLPEIWQAEIFQAARQLNSDSLILQPVITSTYGQHHRIDSLWRSQTCNTHPQALAEAVKLVWSELFTANSLLYWHQLGLSSDRVDVAVLVRPLKAAYATGIIDISADLIRIKASWGLEHSLLQGDVQPDEYDVDRQTGAVLSQHLGHKNYAYRPTAVDRETPFLDCLEAYIPGENLAETYVLNQEAIARLLQLTQNLLVKQPQLRHLSWTVLQQAEFAATPHFYFTWLDDNPTTITAVSKTATLSTARQPLLSGVAASPGSIRATIVIVKDFARYSHQIPAGSILVAKTIPPQHIALIEQVGGIITETGGKTSHGAIVARELNIPAIVNAVDAINVLQNEDQVVLDGSEGKVYPATARQVAHASGDRLLFPTYPIATKLMVNLSQPEGIGSAIDLPIDGVGLLRSELLLADFLSSQSLAQWQETFQREFVATLTNSLRQFVSAFAPRPIFYRSLDLYAQDTVNPVLGDRGTYSYLSNSTLFDLELEAMAAIIAEGHHNLNLILPFVRSVEEFQFCYRRLENVGLTAQNSFQVWIMAEVPSVILLLPEYVRAGVRGIAIGTNDLTQLLLGVDREQAQFADRSLNANHPAMHKAIAQLIETAIANKIECCICGQAPVDYPSLIDKLIQWGITAISVEPEAVSRTYRAIARAERRILLGEVMGNK
ncbi:hypothetical protein IQ255_13205 [Pleurocapsales cyanobacterium LEGE 10410]|nr:hypothetical protein [Pleurocapsales cyanobacterium LEGE 10410]